MEKKKIIFTFLIALVILAIATTVKASSVGMTLETTSKLKAGDVVTATLKIANMDAGDGIDAIAATIDYDEEVFEEVTEDDLDGMNKWNINIYNTATKMFTATKSSKVATASDVLTIKLKAKSSVSADSTIVSVKDITVSGGAEEDGGTGDIVVDNINCTILKAVPADQDINIDKPNTKNPGTTDPDSVVGDKKAEGTEKTTPTEETKTTEPEADKAKETVVPETTSGTDESTAKTLPKTGETTYMIIAAVVAIATLTILVCIKYKKIELK